MNDEVQVAGTSDDELRKQAISSLKKKDAFKVSLVAYVLVNAFLVGIWALSGSGAFWPVWVIGGWGIGLGFQAYDAYGRRAALNEDEVQREIQRLRGG
ncbi:MAG: 2TM domain-containing protein [Solirubrobacterales bacterium]